MQRLLNGTIALLAWFAVIVQLILMLNNRVVGLPETLIRFFSFFTILTNLLVALFFTGRLLNINSVVKPGRLTAVTSYILVVGIVYQLLLRQAWHPTGLQKLVDELLHTIIPLLVLLYWWLYEKGASLHYKQIGWWLVYPLVYFTYTLVRGLSTGYYPYPFINVNELGIKQALINGVFILIFFMLLQVFLIAIMKRVRRK
jgi:hypothetical protein